MSNFSILASKNKRGLLNKYRDCFVPRNDAPNLRHCEGRIDRSNLAKRSHEHLEKIK